jgi:hypothetical protein
MIIASPTRLVGRRGSLRAIVRARHCSSLFFIVPAAANEPDAASSCI